MRSRFSFTAAITLLFCACSSTTAVRPNFINPPSVPPARGYSQIAEVPPGARLVFISGQVALDPSGNLVGRGDLRAQAVQVFENLKNALAAVGSTFSDVVKINFYVTDASQLEALRDVRDRYVDRSAPPASTLVEVRRLAREEFLLEVEVVAIAGRRE